MSIKHAHHTAGSLEGPRQSPFGEMIWLFDLQKTKKTVSGNIQKTLLRILFTTKSRSVRDFQLSWIARLALQINCNTSLFISYNSRKFDRR